MSDTVNDDNFDDSIENNNPARGWPQLFKSWLALSTRKITI